ncbi:hypothetical protein [Chryseobacterium taiwanense]|uniref:Uncharacterized protein n=1 Tax=Chryseobacterium taiwanense TaxID=363331 RepID=A0A0B4E9A0_9FLAO|nr:hypothetical protein [Chryseobacterium taiwanense]KIC63203.1 hypothetical protein RM51_09135 [Chryseobacterium taiwanense]
MRNKIIKISCILIAIVCGGYALYQWFNSKTLDYVALPMVVIFPLLAALLPNYNRTNYIFKIKHSDWMRLSDGHYRLTVPFKVHGIENPKPSLYLKLNGELTKISGSKDVKPNHDIELNVNHTTYEGELRITS